MNNDKLTGPLDGIDTWSRERLIAAVISLELDFRFLMKAVDEYQFKHAARLSLSEEGLALVRALKRSKQSIGELK